MRDIKHFCLFRRLILPLESHYSPARPWAYASLCRKHRIRLPCSGKIIRMREVEDGMSLADIHHWVTYKLRAPLSMSLWVNQDSVFMFYRERERALPSDQFRKNTQWCGGKNFWFGGTVGRYKAMRYSWWKWWEWIKTVKVWTERC